MNKELLMEDCMCEPCEAGGSYDVNMEPDDIEVSDTVTVIWELGWKSHEKSTEDIVFHTWKDYNW